MNRKDHSSGVQKSGSKVLAALVPFGVSVGESRPCVCWLSRLLETLGILGLRLPPSSLGSHLHMAAFSPVLTQHLLGMCLAERERENSGVSSYEDTNPIRSRSYLYDFI